MVYPGIQKVGLSRAPNDPNELPRVFGRRTFRSHLLLLLLLRLCACTLSPPAGLTDGFSEPPGLANHTNDARLCVAKPSDGRPKLRQIRC